MRLIKLISISICLCFVSCSRLAKHVKMDVINISEFNFDSYLGYNLKDSNAIYSLLGLGFFQTPKSIDADSLIKIWIDKHPRSVVLPVCTINASGKNRVVNKNLIYCWIVDKSDTINVFLIRNGCFPASTLQRPKTWEEMSREEKSLYPVEEKPDITVHIDKEVYKTFLKQIYSAEKYAKENKLGIWNDSIR